MMEINVRVQFISLSLRPINDKFLKCVIVGFGDAYQQ